MANLRKDCWTAIDLAFLENVWRSKGKQKKKQFSSFFVFHLFFFSFFFFLFSGILNNFERYSFALLPFSLFLSFCFWFFLKNIEGKKSEELDSLKV